MGAGQSSGIWLGAGATGLGLAEETLRATAIPWQSGPDRQPCESGPDGVDRLDATVKLC